MDDYGAWAAVFLAIAAGGFLKGATGAGAPVVGVPVLVLLFDVQMAVAIMAVPNLVSNLWQGWQHRARALPARFTWRFALIAGVGAFVGSVMLASLPPDALLIGVALAVFAYIGFRLAMPDWILGLTPAIRLTPPVAAAAGVLQGATGLAAPVILTFFNAMQLARPVFIATISISFGLMALAQIPPLWFFGILTPERAVMSTAAVLPLLLAMPLGAYAARHVPARVFDRMILALLALIALRMLWRALI